MKAGAFVLLSLFCAAECLKKTYAPIDKNANIDFINMESGGVNAGARPASRPNLNQGPIVPAPAKNSPIPAPTTKPPAPVTPKIILTPPTPTATPTPVRPVYPTQAPHQIKPVPVNPAPAVNPITTPGPGSVQHLINFYDNQGKGSPIRPYSYSQAVKQG